MPSSTSAPVIKCVVVGDGAVGKTCLLISYAQGNFPDGYVPTVFDNYAVQVPVGEENVTINLFDTAGQEDYDRLRPLAYTNASVFLVCFSLTNRSSLENAEEKWIPELRKYARGVPFLLVGTQSDRRDQAPAQAKTVSTQEGKAMAKRLGAVEYVECSAKSREGVREVFVSAIMTSLNQPAAAGGKTKGKASSGGKAGASYKKKSGCTIG